MATKRKAGRRTAARGRRPDVILDVDYEQGLMFLVLRNIGNDLACHVSVTFMPRLVGLGGERVVSDAAIFRKLAYLAPGKLIRVFFDSGSSFFGRQKETAFRARVQYRDRSGVAYAETFAHDLEVYRDLPETAKLA